MKIYKVHSFDKIILWFFIFLAFAVIVFAFIGIIDVIFKLGLFINNRNPFMLLWWIGFLVIAIGVEYFLLHSPVEIKILDGNIEFTSLIKKITVSLEEINSIKRIYAKNFNVKIKYIGGSIILMFPFGNFDDFVDFLRKNNPNIEIKEGLGGWQ